MKSLTRQSGWYTGALLFAAVVAVALFIAQPWIPLLLAAAIAVAFGVVALTRGGDYLKRWYHEHHPHAR